MVSLVARGLTTGVVQAHLAEVYGTEVSRQTISTVTDSIGEGMEAWRARPLEPVYVNARGHFPNEQAAGAPVPSRVFEVKRG